MIPELTAAQAPVLTDEMREKLAPILGQMSPEDRWYCEQRIRLLMKYRWTPHIIDNPVRMFWHHILFPFFHWRLALRHNALVWRAAQRETHQKIGSWVMRLLLPFAEASEEVALRTKEADDHMRDLDRRIKEQMA